jgi:hypothetical protein
MTSFVLLKKDQEKVISIGGGTGETKHSFTEREKKAYVNYINETLSLDSDLQGSVPINVDNNDVFEVISKGILIW